MPSHKKSIRKAEPASPNVTLMLTELTEIHVRLLSCFQQNETIKQWTCEIDDVVERIFQAVKEPD